MVHHSVDKKISQTSRALFSFHFSESTENLKSFSCKLLASWVHVSDARMYIYMLECNSVDSGNISEIRT